MTVRRKKDAVVRIVAIELSAESLRNIDEGNTVHLGEIAPDVWLKIRRQPAGAKPPDKDQRPKTKDQFQGSALT